MSPTRFREGGLHETIRFATAPCELGLLLVAATERGVCSVMLGDEPAALERLLRQQFRAATILPDASGMTEQVKAVLAAMTNHPAAGDIPLDVRATAFQARVWQALRQIPRGADAQLCAIGTSHRSTDRGSGGGPGLRYQPGRYCCSLPPRYRE